MYNETSDIPQDKANDEPEELPAYGDLEEQERSNPNSRFGRWRSWVEKRAAERYADISEDDRERQRQRGWGATVITDTPVEAPPGAGSTMSPMSAQLASHHLESTNLSVYQFGSRFIPHSTARITSIVPVLDERYLLLGTTEGMGLLDVFPENEGVIVADPLMVHPLEGAKRRDMWTGEAIHQMTILESYPDRSGGIQGVLLALVGPEESEVEREAARSLRLYDLSSIFSLVKLVTSNPDVKPLVIHQPKGWTHQHTSKRLHRSINHSISITRGLKSMMIDGHGSKPATPAESTSSLTAVSITSDRQLPQHQDSKDSKDSADSWDMVDDLPLRWATNYVPLATAGSKLAALQPLFYEVYRDDNNGTWTLAVATKTCILLYETPKGGRSFRYIKEFYTPLPARSISFIHQASRENQRSEGERLRKERPLSRLPDSVGGLNTSPRLKRMSTQTTQGDQTPVYKSQLSLFVIFERKAGLIRISDSVVSEIELWDNGDVDRSPSPPSTIASPISMRTPHSLSSFRLGGGAKAMWLPVVTLELPVSIPNSNSLLSPPAGSTTLLFMSKGRQTHIYTSPLPTSMSSRKPLRVHRWSSPPRQITARVSMGSPSEGREMKLQILAFNDQGVEVLETGLDFLSRPVEISSLSKGKGRVKRVPTPPEPFVRTSWEPTEMTGYLGRGGHWNTLDTSSGRPEMRPALFDWDPKSADSFGSRTERGQGLYVWLQKGMDDYRVAWLGEDATA